LAKLFSFYLAFEKGGISMWHFCFMQIYYFYMGLPIKGYGRCATNDRYNHAHPSQLTSNYDWPYACIVCCCEGLQLIGFDQLIIQILGRESEKVA
jgi:hypothetical protein